MRIHAPPPPPPRRSHFTGNLLVLNSGAVVAKIVKLTFVSPFMGLAFAIALIFCLEMTNLDRDVEITITFSLCYLCFWCAEEAGLSGILAIVIMALAFKAYGQRSLSPELGHFFHDVWEWIGYIGNSLLFFISGALVAQVLPGSTGSDVVLCTTCGHCSCGWVKRDVSSGPEPYPCAEGVAAS